MLSYFAHHYAKGAAHLCSAISVSKFAKDDFRREAQLCPAISVSKLAKDDYLQDGLLNNFFKITIEVSKPCCRKRAALDGPQLAVGARSSGSAIS